MIAHNEAMLNSTTEVSEELVNEYERRKEEIEVCVLATHCHHYLRFSSLPPC